MTLVYGDSHTCTHGAFGFGIDASECECVLRTQTLQQRWQRTMRVWLDGALLFRLSVKDMVLALIARIGAADSAGHAIEYAGPAVSAWSKEARMTLCNMSIEAGSRIGLVAPDKRSFAFLEGRPIAPSGAAWESAPDTWRSLPFDPDARFDREAVFDVNALTPHVSWGTSPEETMPIEGRVPGSGKALMANMADGGKTPIRSGEPLKALQLSL